MAEAASMEPTDRSMPAVTIIIVWPIAIMPTVDIPRRMLKIFCGFRKKGLVKLITMIRTINAVKTPISCD